MNKTESILRNIVAAVIASVLVVYVFETSLFVAAFFVCFAFAMAVENIFDLPGFGIAVIGLFLAVMGIRTWIISDATFVGATVTVAAIAVLLFAGRQYQSKFSVKKS